MLHRHRSAADESRDHQRELAATLIAGLGYHRAIDECLRNGWDGVLGVLMDTRHPPGHAEPGRAPRS